MTTAMPVTMPNNDNNHNCNSNNFKVNQLNLKEYPTSTKLSWLSGYDLWNLRAIPPPPSNTRPTSRPPSPKTSLRLSDGPHGIRKPLSDLSITQAYPATCFPSACALACSWNTALLKNHVASALRDECLSYDIHILLGPGVNLKRHPFGGRNHEYFSEDPYLTGHLAKAFIHGIQQQQQQDERNNDEEGGQHPEGQSSPGKRKKKKQKQKRVAACLKHFALNNQETYRMIINVICDERTIRELYLPAFEICLSAEYYDSDLDASTDGDENESDSDHAASNSDSNSDSDSTSNSTNQQQQQQQQPNHNHNHNHNHIHNPPKLVMGAYNKVNGLYCCEHKWLLQTILREEWKFGSDGDDGDDGGVIVSDWGAIHNRLESIKAGCDLEMPGCPKNNQGVFDTEILDTMARGGDGDGGSAGQEIVTAIDQCATRVVRLISDYASSSSTSTSTSTSTSSLVSSSSSTKERGNGVEEDDNKNSNDDDEVAVQKRRQHMFEAHHQIAREVAQECIVLLQNQNQILPLSIEDYTHHSTTTTTTTTTTSTINTTVDTKKKKRRRRRTVAVIGEFGKQSPRIQGMGSAHVTATHITSMYDALQSLLVPNTTTTTTTTSSEIPFARGYDADADCEDEDEDDTTCIDQGLIDEAVEMVTRTTTTTTDNTDTTGVDTILICIGLPEIMESEGFDRTSLKLPQQHIQLVEAILRACQNHENNNNNNHNNNNKKNVVIVLSHGNYRCYHHHYLQVHFAESSDIYVSSSSSSIPSQVVL